MNKHFQQIIGFFFLVITLSLASANGGPEKVQPKPLNNSTKIYARGTSYYGDKETSTGIPVQTLLSMGIIPVAVDPNIVRYGSEIKLLNKDGSEKKTYDHQGRQLRYFAVDTGPDVVDRVASKCLAAKKGLGSIHRDAPVLDFYAPKDITPEWDHFEVIRYTGPPFLGLKLAQKLAVISKNPNPLAMM